MIYIKYDWIYYRYDWICTKHYCCTKYIGCFPKFYVFKVWRLLKWWWIQWYGLYDRSTCLFYRWHVPFWCSCPPEWATRSGGPASVLPRWSTRRTSATSASRCHHTKMCTGWRKLLLLTTLTPLSLSSLSLPLTSLPGGKLDISLSGVQEWIRMPCYKGRFQSITGKYWAEVVSSRLCGALVLHPGHSR